MYKYLRCTLSKITEGDIDALSKDEKNGSYPVSWKHEFSPKNRGRSTEVLISLYCSSSGCPDESIPCFRIKLEGKVIIIGKFGLQFDILMITFLVTPGTEESQYSDSTQS